MVRPCAPLHARVDLMRVYLSFRNVKPPSPIQAFDPLCEVQSDKASVEITSPFEGIVKDILVKEGEVAKVGSGLCVIEVEEEDSNQPDAPEHPPPTSSVPDVTPISYLPEKLSGTRKSKLHPLDPRASADTDVPFPLQSSDVLATPSVRHYARQNGVELSVLAPGSGKAGRIEKQDVDRYLARSTPTRMLSAISQEPHALGEEMVVELGRTRYNMWKAMTKVCRVTHCACKRC